MATVDKVYLADKQTLDNVDTKVGITTDIGGTSSTGSLMAKLNKLINDLGTLKNSFSDSITAVTNAITGKGITVAEGTKLSGIATLIGSIPTPYDGSLPSKSVNDLSVSGATVTVPSGYYASQVQKSVSSGSASTPATTIAQSTPSISVNSNGLITASVAATSASVTPTVSAGYISSGTAGTITMSASSNTKQLSVYGGSVS